MGLLAIIFFLMAAVGFLTFGFTQAVCKTPPIRWRTGSIDTGSVIVHGFAYNFTHFQHPAVSGTFTGKTNPLYEGGYKVAGMDASFLFQNTNNHCRNFVGPANGTSIPAPGGNMQWYFPCNTFNQNGTSIIDKTGYDQPKFCHVTTNSRKLFQQLASGSKKVPGTQNGQVYYTWDDLRAPNRNLAVYEQ